ncbi:MAG: hypothetical protein JWO31_3333 [Phycisphaerales bacterium]|nr:hypothetical protein [Phycisphaerales bacterium]
MDPRSSARRLSRRPTRPAPAGSPAGPQIDPGSDDGLTHAHFACRLALRIARALHEAGSEPVRRKRVLLGGLCAAAGADRGVLAVTRTDLRTGRHDLVSAVAGHMPTTAVSAEAASAEGRPPPDGRSQDDERSTRASSAGLPYPPSLVDEAVPGAADDPFPSVAVAGPGPVLDTFLPLNGLRLVACLTLARPPGAPRFAAADRALVELLHAECAGVYAHDRHLADPAVWDAPPPAERRALQDVLARHNSAAVARRQGTAVAAAERLVATVFGRLGVSSRSELIARWGE